MRLILLSLLSAALILASVEHLIFAVYVKLLMANYVGLILDAVLTLALAYVIHDKISSKTLQNAPGEESSEG